LLAQVRQNPEWTHIPIIFLTAKGDPRDVHRGLSSGVEEYVAKPYDGDELLETLTTLLNRSFRRQEAATEDFESLKQSILNLLQTDFRTPLATVSTYSSTLSHELEEAQTNQDLKHSLSAIQQGSLRISELVEDFIVLAEVKTGEAEHALWLRGGPTNNVAVLLAQACELGIVPERFAGLQLITSGLDELSLPPVWVDYERLQTAFVRLLLVVAELCHHGAGSTVWLTAVADDTEVCLQVRHDSPALAQDPELVRLINILFVAGGEEIIEHSSFGAALCLVQGVVKVHHGRVTLTTTNNNIPHDTFTICLPIFNEDTHAQQLFLRDER
jgi:K+-sensing histidine kinase KdpD